MARDGVFFPDPADLARADVSAIGGKAASLARLTTLGFDVPAFFAIDPALSPPLGPSDYAAALARLGPGPYAVRSSGRDEDGASHSHAGQFLSLLNVEAADVADAVDRVQASGQAEGLQIYRATQGLDADGGAPAVIVQIMVKARTAGVAFSADPVSGRRNRIVISAIAGLGDRLVGGAVDGAEYVVEGGSGRVLAEPLETGPLSPADVAAVAALAASVASAVGCPQDIEWAFEGDRLYLLQARAITTPLRPAAIPDKRITIFDNSNIVESYPGLVSPLTYSFAQYAYARVYRSFLALAGVKSDTIALNAAALENMLGRIDGRVYYNLVNWYRLLALLPGFRLNRAHMETMMGVGAPLPIELADALAPAPARGLGKIAEWGRLARTATTLVFEAVRLRGTVTRFYARLNAALAEPSATIEQLPLTDLAVTYRRIEADLLDRWDAPLINDFLCMIAFGSSRTLTQRWLGEDGLALHNDIMIGQGDIVSAEPPQWIARMGRLVADDPAMIDALLQGDRSAVRAHPELDAEIRAYIDRFGDRCTEELKLESITLDADPTPLLSAIGATARSGSTSAQRERGGGLERLGGLLQGKPLKRIGLTALLGWTKARVRDRENLRFERTRIFGRARRVFLAIGRQFCALDRLDAERDVFFLTVQEVLGAIEGFGLDQDLKALVEMRKQQFAVDRDKPDPADRITLTGAMVAREPDAPKIAGKASSSEEWQGTGCSAGLVTAPARVIRDPAREQLVRGEILVAQYTDPGWIALFTNASAIVVERGSLLSHSAIVARELGIPCVVGLKGAMTDISTGDMLEVDGANGRVRRLP